jgi:hypothetical protein
MWKWILGICGALLPFLMSTDKNSRCTYDFQLLWMKDNSLLIQADSGFSMTLDERQFIAYQSRFRIFYDFG